MFPGNQKLQNLVKISLIFIAVGCFALPSYSHAAGSPGSIITTPLWETLKDNTTLHDFWKQMMALVNSFVVLLLIVVAFCEILNINISTYGVKKILPSLVFAVLAANFSWIMCRLFIDWANIAMSRFSDTTSIIDPLISSRSSFTINLTDTNNQASGAKILADSADNISFFQAGMKTLFVWVGAIALYILAFLLLLRNAIIVALAVFSPIAFMAMVLPQTKAMFNKWWTTFMQWTFMPTVSVFMLWMGSKIQETISNADPLIGFLIAVGFIYGAIKVPFSMSGAASGIMNKWADMGKKTAKFAGNAAYTVSGAKATVSGAKAVVDYQKELMKTRADVTKTKLANKLKDLTGFGSGLDIQKDKLARAQKRSKGISDKKVGDYISRRGRTKPGEMTGRQKRYAMEEAETQAMEGTTDMANKGLLAGLANEAEKGTPLGEKIKTMRTSSQKAGYEIAAFEKDWARLNDEMKINLMKGTAREGENIEDVIKSGKWANGDAMTEKEKKDGQAQLDFLKQYSKSVLDGDLTALSAKSAEGKAVQRVADERQSIDNAASPFVASEKMYEALKQYNVLTAKGASRTQAEIDALNANTKALLEEGYDMSSSAKATVSSHQIMNKYNDTKTAYDNKIAQLNKAYAKPGSTAATKNDIPAYLQQYAKFDSNGLLNGLRELSSDDRKQIQTMVGGKIKSGASEDAENYGVGQLKEFITKGKKGDWDEAAYKNWVAGNSEMNSGTANRKLITALEALGANIVTGMKATTGTSGEAMRAKIDTYYATGQGLARMKRLAEQINKSYEGKTIIKTGAGTNAGTMHDEIMTIFNGGAAALAHLKAAGVETTNVAGRATNAVANAQSTLADVLKKPEGLKGGDKNRTVSDM